MTTAPTPFGNSFMASDSYGLGPVFAIRKAFATTGSSSAADVVLWNAECPFAVRVLDVLAFVSGAVSATTVTLRDATGGGGTALSNAISTAALGTVRGSTNTTGVVAQGGSLVLRKSNGTVAGEVVVLLMRQ